MSLKDLLVRAANRVMAGSGKNEMVTDGESYLDALKDSGEETPTFAAPRKRGLAEEEDVPEAEVASIWNVSNLWVKKLTNSTAVRALGYDPIKSHLYVSYLSSPKKYYVYGKLSIKDWIALTREKSKGRKVAELKAELELVGILHVTGRD